MGFIIRSAFWLSLVLMLIPVEGTGNDNQASVSPLQAFFAARDAVADVGGMCERKPDVCQTGRAALDTIGMRARESAKFAFELIEQKQPAEDGHPRTDIADAPDTTIKTGTVTAE